MGRGRKIYIGYDRRVRADRITPIKDIKTPQQLVMFLDQGSGPVQESLFEMGIVGFARSGNYEIRPDKVQAAIADLRKTIVDIREIPREETERIAAQIGERRNLSARQVINANDREHRIKAQSIRMVANAAGLNLTPADKRTLTQVENGLHRAAYGSKGQFSDGTLKTRVFRRSGPVRSSDSSARARAREQAERLRETAGRVSASGRARAAVTGQFRQERGLGNAFIRRAS